MYRWTRKCTKCKNWILYGFQNLKYITFTKEPIILHAIIQNSALTSSNSFSYCFNFEQTLEKNTLFMKTIAWPYVIDIFFNSKTTKLVVFFVLKRVDLVISNFGRFFFRTNGFQNHLLLRKWWIISNWANKISENHSKLLIYDNNEFWGVNTRIIIHRTYPTSYRKNSEAAFLWILRIFLWILID